MKIKQDWISVKFILFCLSIYETHSGKSPKKGTGDDFDWSSWWSYDGISGPGFWGVINRKWSLCSDGLRQSPADLVTKSIVYDHTLSEISIESDEVDGYLSNTGFGLKWIPTPESFQPSSKISSSASIPRSGTVQHISTLGQPTNRFVLSGGPFIYKYTLSHVVIRWSTTQKGSEHSIEGQAFPAEVQLHCFNSDLYKNFTDAHAKPNGLAAVSILLRVGWSSNSVLKILIDKLHMVPHRGKSTFIPFVPIRELFTSNLYLTYEGSLTEPSCEETVTWVILNKPAYITADQLFELQSLRGGSHGYTSPSMGNIRPLQPLNNRVIRTNIPLHELSCTRTNRTGLYKASEIGSL